MTTLSARVFEKALAAGDIDTIRMDVGQGNVDLNKPTSRYGLLPLHTAAWHGRTAMVDFLIQYGAALEGRSEEGLTALLLACQRAHWPTAMRLIAMGADAEASDNGRNQAIHFAAEREGGEGLWPALAERGVKVEARNAQGWTPLHVAAKSGHPQMVQCLVDAGADINSRDQEGHTPLLLAARERRIESLWILHGLGADELARNRMGEGIGDIVDPLLFVELGRDHDVYWWLRPLMPLQKRHLQPTLTPAEPELEAAPVRINRPTP